MTTGFIIGAGGGLGEGSGLEICDIGMALYVDETKGLRRYLNGQIVDINTNTQAFLNRLQQITTLHPSLLCTEEEWQTAKTNSAFGQVGKFVFNYGADGITVESVRIPRVVNIQGVFDLQNLGMTVEAGLPNHTHNLRLTGEESGESHYVTMGNLLTSHYATTSKPLEQTIYGKSNTVQPEAIQYPYFIQIATGSETENNIINDIELNNPYSFGDSKYSPIELNNISLLKSNGQWNAKGTYPAYYDWILTNVNNGVERFKLSTAEDITDYDWRINTTDETFMLPLLDGSEDLVSDRYDDFELLASGSTYTAPANGWFWLAKKSASNQDGYIYFKNITKNYDNISWKPTTSGAVHLFMKVSKGDEVLCNYTVTGSVEGFRFIYAKGNGSLYYYVGETVQNANLINAGRIGEQLANKADKTEVDGEWVKLQEPASLSAAINLNASTPIELDLTNFLPQDNNSYECLISAGLTTGKSSGNYGAVSVFLTNDSTNYINLCGAQTRTSSSVIARGSSSVPVGTDRKIYIYRKLAWTGTLDFLNLIAYRRLGKIGV